MRKFVRHSTVWAKLESHFAQGLALQFQPERQIIVGTCGLGRDSDSHRLRSAIPSDQTRAHDARQRANRLYLASWQDELLRQPTILEYQQ